MMYDVIDYDYPVKRPFIDSKQRKALLYMLQLKPKVNVNAMDMKGWTCLAHTTAQSAWDGDHGNLQMIQVHTHTHI